jgi:hypothetical protein
MKKKMWENLAQDRILGSGGPGRSPAEIFLHLAPVRREMPDPIVADFPEGKISGASRKANELPTRAIATRNRCASAGRRRPGVAARENARDLELGCRKVGVHERRVDVTRRKHLQIR